jgi:hypothetical protein
MMTVGWLFAKQPGGLLPANPFGVFTFRSPSTALAASDKLLFEKRASITVYAKDHKSSEPSRFLIFRQRIFKIILPFCRPDVKPFGEKK